MKRLKKTNFKDFYKVNEHVAHTSPMMTHYHSENPFERWLWKNKKKIIEKLLSEIKPESLVDLGCGDGGMIEVIGKKTTYTGIDISPTQLANAKKHIKKNESKKIKFICADILDSGLKDNSFDVALLCDVVEHVLSPKTLLQEAQRITKKGGYIILSIPNEMLWELSRLALLRFPLRSPDHINAIYPKDIEKTFHHVKRKNFIPVPFSSHLSLIHIYLILNDK